MNMPKLDQLLCHYNLTSFPVVKIGSVIDYEQPGKYIVQSTRYDDTYPTPVLTAGQTFVLGYTDDKSGIYAASKDNPVIIFDDFTGAFKWVDFPFKVKSSAMKLLTAKEKAISLRYFFHLMGHINFTSDEHKRLWIATYSNFFIPLPPLEVQQEIVQILDQFTQLTAELTAELTARKEQYKYYSLSLLNKATDTKRVPLSSLGTWCGGCTPSMANPAFWSNGNIPWVSSKDMKTPLLADTQDHITQEALTQTPIKLLPKNTIAIVARSGILKHTLPVVFIPFETTVNQDIKALTVALNVDPRYAYHVINANSDDILRKAKKQGGTVDSLDIQKFMNYLVPLPPLPEQRRIVAILDRFDALCNDLTSGLPAEIAARQRQYEYYRDKLLTFREKA